MPRRAHVPVPVAPPPPAHQPAAARPAADRSPLALVQQRLGIHVASFRCAPAAVQTTATELLRSCFASDADARAPLRQSAARVTELLGYITGDPRTRIGHLNTLNNYLVATQKIWKLAPKKADIALDTAFVNSIVALPEDDKINLFTFLNRKVTPHSAIDKLREYVFSNGEEKAGQDLTDALKLIGRVGILQDAAITKGLLRGWLLADEECVENGGDIPAARMTAPVLRQHFEKHCCNMHGNNRPAEAAWWAVHLRHTFRLQDVRDAGFVLTAADISELCPHGGQEIKSAHLVELLFAKFGTGARAQVFAQTLAGKYEDRYRDYIEDQFENADGAFVRFEGGKIQVAARKGLYFMMATYNPQPGNAYRLELMSAYFPDNLDAHWTRLQGDLIWWIKRPAARLAAAAHPPVVVGH